MSPPFCTYVYWPDVSRLPQHRRWSSGETCHSDIWTWRSRHVTAVSTSVGVVSTAVPACVVTVENIAKIYESSPPVRIQKIRDSDEPACCHAYRGIVSPPRDVLSWPGGCRCWHVGVAYHLLIYVESTDKFCFWDNGDVYCATFMSYNYYYLFLYLFPKWHRCQHLWCRSASSQSWWPFSWCWSSVRKCLLLLLEYK